MMVKPRVFSVVCPHCLSNVAACALPRHQNSRPCRYKQIVRIMAQLGWSSWERFEIARWIVRARLPYHRFPARPKGYPNVETAWTVPPAPLPPTNSAFYDGLHDMYFFPDWLIAMLHAIKNRLDDHVLVIQKPLFYMHSLLLKTAVPLHGAGDEAQKAFLTIYHLNGSAAAMEYAEILAGSIVVLDDVTEEKAPL